MIVNSGEPDEEISSLMRTSIAIISILIPLIVAFLSHR